jgi:hypothetical protein
MLEVYIDDLVVKLGGFTDHLADLRLALERMRKYGLRMNPLKCVFGITTGRFLWESIKGIEEPVCKRGVQKLLGKINYLRRFISNLAGRVDVLTVGKA